MNREDFRDQMTRCKECGKLCDGDVCDEDCAERLRALALQLDEDVEPTESTLELIG